MTKHTHGGKRPGAGRPKRTDGRISIAFKIAVTPEEAALIRDWTEPDNRRKILLAHLNERQRQDQL